MEHGSNVCNEPESIRKDGDNILSRNESELDAGSLCSFFRSSVQLDDYICFLELGKLELKDVGKLQLDQDVKCLGSDYNEDHEESYFLGMVELLSDLGVMIQGYS